NGQGRRAVQVPEAGERGGRERHRDGERHPADILGGLAGRHCDFVRPVICWIARLHAWASGAASLPFDRDSWATWRSLGNASFAPAPTRPHPAAAAARTRCSLSSLSNVSSAGTTSLGSSMRASAVAAAWRTDTSLSLSTSSSGSSAARAKDALICPI